MKLGSVFSRIKDKFHASARMGAALTAVFIAAVVVVNVVIYGLSSRFGWYFATGETYEHTIDPAKSELYGGQKVTYCAPYNRCDRIEDYRRAWAHFEKVFNEEK